MLFNSLDFLFFFPVVTILFFLLPHRFRWALLLSASCFFYMYFIPVYILILFFTIIIDYYAGLFLEDARDQKRKKLLLACSLVANIGILAVFKYYNFFLDNINTSAAFLTGHPTALRYLGLALPIGLSFHTFQAMSYTFEVYYGRQKAERHFGIYALYVMFYPQLVAGPIERPQNILHQFHEKKTFQYERLRDGLGMMIWGMFKKVVIADTLSQLVNIAYDHPAQQSGFVLLLATYFFAIQIYCDFSGYSDIAIGASKVMGYDLMENFRTPYVSKSIREFWSRWHISLSTWFRDYLYIPLGGNKVSALRWKINLLIVFIVSGIWHGANWTYVIWGALQGTYLVFGIIKDKMLESSPFNDKLNSSRSVSILNTIITFHLALFAWIFFRAKSISDSVLVIKNILHGAYNSKTFSDALTVFANQPSNNGKIIFQVLLVVFFLSIDPLMDKLVKNKITFRQPVYRYAVYSALIAGIVILGFFGKIQFIYFQF